MRFSLSHSFNVGPFKVTASPSGFTGSFGIPGARVSLNTKGEAGVSLGIPGTGLSFRKKKKLLKSK